uniref:RING-type domain-containing protein n=1 Tax=Acrobeloides nanus TaxID=290746 RepID=A0A914C5S4_9BILA
MLQASELPSYLEVNKIIEFVHTRNLDQSAATILSYSVLVLCGMLLFLPLSKLIQVYLHALSILLFGLAHHLSICYVQQEQNSDPDLKLDDFVKLERHAFNFLAQLMLSVAQCIIIGIESDIGRVLLAVFTIPIIARMCGCPVDKLIIAHNIACSAAMLFICIYVLTHVPSMIQSLKRGCRRVRAVLVVRGIAFGAVMFWKRLRIAELLTCGWLVMFSLRFYSEIIKQTPYGTGFIAAIAETTNSPFTLLALALTIGYGSQLVVKWTQIAIGSAPSPNQSGSQGYAEALTLVFLCAQAGVLGMRTEQKTFMLKLVLFIVLSALLQSLYDILEPQMLAYAAMTYIPFSKHIRCLVLAGILTFAPFGIAYMLMSFVPVDLWFIIIISNCLLISVRTISTTVIYFLTCAENRSPEPWERFDDLIFLCKILTRFVELALALFVVFYGGYTSITTGQWTVVSVVVLVVHTYFNVWRRVHSAFLSIKARQEAAVKINCLIPASQEELKNRSDLCAICFGEMSSGARITPCKHVFHGFCLRKWLFVRAVCPLCYADLSKDGNFVEKQEGNSWLWNRHVQTPNQVQEIEAREQIVEIHHVSAEENVQNEFAALIPGTSVTGGVDLEALAVNDTSLRFRGLSNSSDWSSDSSETSDGTEYTLQSSDDNATVHM